MTRRTSSNAKSEGDTTHAAAVKLIKQAAGPNAKANSGVIDGAVEIALGASRTTRPSRRRQRAVSVPQGRGAARLRARMSVRDYGVELSSVGGKSYVSLGETGYAMPPAVRRRLVRSPARGENGLTRTLEQFGIAPWRWETDQRVTAPSASTVSSVAARHELQRRPPAQGRETLMGVLSARHHAGRRAARADPGERTPVRCDHGHLEGRDSWFDPAEKVLRKSGFTLKFKVPEAAGGARRDLRRQVVGRLSVTEVGKPQKIEAPTELGSYADFQLALDALGEAQEFSAGHARDPDPVAALRPVRVSN